VPFDQSYHERLSELGEATEGEEEAEATWYEPPAEEQLTATHDAMPAPTHATVEVPDFNDVIERGGTNDIFAIEETSPVSGAAATTGGGDGGAVEFEWNSVAMPEVEESKAEDTAAVSIDPNSSFADLNEDLDDMAVRSSTARATTAFGAGDLNVGAFDDSALAPEKETGDGRVRVLLAQELESVDYYLAQGYSDIARDTLDMLERQYGADEEITRRRRQLAQEEAGDAYGFAMPSVTAEAEGETGGETPAEFETFAQFDSFVPVEETEEVEISGQLFIDTEEEAAPALDAHPAPDIEAQFAPIVEAQPFTPQSAAPQSAAPQPSPQSPPSPGLHPDLADMFDEFRDEAEADAPDSAGDYETHYNTALAYREMGLVDQAVEELQAAIALAAPQDGTPRYLQCCNMLGHCFMQKNLPHPAAMWFRKGLDAPGHTEDEYQALRYELGAAYEQMGDLERAIRVFSEVYGTDVNYRGVAAKLRDLQARKEVTSDK
jgi:tetratricopeptide (TPR) repeat protein